MSTAIADAARDATKVRQRSGDADRAFDALMGLPPWRRRLVVADLEAGEVTQVLASGIRQAGTPYALWVDDPIGFVEQVLGESMWSKQRQVVNATARYKRIAVPAGFGLGKCVGLNAMIPLADGRFVRAEDLVGTEFEIVAWREDGTQIPRRARAGWNAVEPVFRVRTHSGREVVRNAQHLLWAAEPERVYKSKNTGLKTGKGTKSIVPKVKGWTPVGKLAVGDLLLVPESHSAEGRRRAPDDHPALLGYLLGDGSTTKDVRFTQQPGPAMEEFRRIVERLGCRLVKLHRPYDWAVRGLTGVKGAGHSNHVLRLVEAWGLRGKTARDKALPGWAWGLPNDQLATVMGRLFACDGYVHAEVRKKSPNRANIQIAVTLASERLIRDIEHAMLRLGVWGYVRHKRVRYNGGYSDAWEWSCRDRDAMARFAEVIDAPGKNEQIARAVEVALSRPTARQRSWPRRNAPAGYRWEKIVEVEQLPDEATVAIEVDGEHTFVTSLVEHNTHLAARAVAWFCCVHPVGTALAVTTATRMRQVHRQMWPHIRRVVARANLPGECDQVQWKMPDLHDVDTVVSYGFTAPEHDEAAMQGIHAPKLLLVVDEAGGIGPVIGRSTRNLLTGDARMLAIGNPAADLEDTWFEGLCNEGTDPLVPDTVMIRIAATDSPAVTGEQTPPCRECAGRDLHPLSEHIVDQAWIDGAIQDHGPEAPYVVAKVHARFPKGGAWQILPADWVDGAADVPDPEGPDWVRLDALGLEGETDPWTVRRGAWVRLGVDVAAAGGDEFVVARAVGDLITVRHASSGEVNASAVNVAGKVLEHIQAAERLARALGSRARVRVKIDGIGVGWGVASILEAWRKEGKHRAEVVSVVVSESPEREPDSDLWRPWQKRDEMWLAMRGLLDPGAGGLPRVRFRLDGKTLAQLRSPRYATNSGGYTVVEAKTAMRKRGLSSPDRGEAVNLTVYEPVDGMVRRSGLYV